MLEENAHTILGYSYRSHHAKTKRSIEKGALSVYDSGSTITKGRRAVKTKKREEAHRETPWIAGRAEIFTTIFQRSETGLRGLYAMD